MFIALALHVALVFPGAPAVAPSILDAARTEAAAIWAPQGIAVMSGDAPCAWDAVVLTVNLVEHVDRRPKGTLGSTVFDGNGEPVAALTIYLDAVRLFIAASRVLGVPERSWPRRMRDEVTGRVLGRVLAHEIGHYVLKSRTHSASGLMRAVHTPDALASPSRAEFMVSEARAG